jgi:hypothetical protein
LSFADPEFREELRVLFDRWRAGMAQKLSSDNGGSAAAGSNADAVATMIIATYSGAMAVAKVEQRGAPLRTCADQMGIIFAAS